MNNLRLIKIYEFRGKIHPIEKYISDLIYGLNESDFSYGKRYYNYGINFFYYYQSKNITIESEILDLKCSPGERREILKYILGKYLNLEINTVYE